MGRLNGKILRSLDRLSCTLSALESFILEWNVDGSSLGKPGPAGIGGVLSDHNRMVLGLSSIPAGVKDSNEAELLAMLKHLNYLLHEKICLEETFWLRSCG